MRTIACKHALVAAALSAGGAACADEAKSLRYAEGSPATSVWAMQAERLSAAVNDESRGTLKLELFLGAQLGSDQDVVQQVARGRVDMGGFGLVFAALLAPELSLLGMPLYFKNPAEHDCVLDGPMGQVVSDALAAKGVQMLGWKDTPSIELLGKRAWTKPGDLAGLKAGTYGTKMGAIFWSGIGANPTPTSNVEIISAYQTGLIDASANAPSYYVTSGLGKVAPVLTRFGSWSIPGMWLMNKAAFEGLGREQREALLRALRRTPVEQLRKEVRDHEAAVRAQHVRNGGQVVELTQEQRDAWRAAVAPLWPKMVENAGPDGPKFYKMMEEARKQCEKR
jgi:TRAP-type transport system periplasmic protein